jgi:hypothetical protein
MADPIVVPAAQLSPEALDGLIEEFVTREGTDYGHAEPSLADKRRAVMRQIDAGEVVIAFDPTTESTNLVPAWDLPDHR